MGRPSRHDPAALVAAAQALAAAGSAADVTIAAVARASGAPVGSIYHRFPSRDALLAAAWLDAVAGFQARFVAAVRRLAEPPGREAALSVTAWSRADPVRARILVLRHPREFGYDTWGEADRGRAHQLSADLEDALGVFCERHLGGRGGDQRRRATFALLDLPQAAVRRYLTAGITPPAEVDAFITAALAALLPGRN